jgi:hypothetical protein
MHPLRWLLPLLLLASWAWSQDVASGPPKGGKVPALKVFDATGPHADKDVDYAAKRGMKPTVYVFVRADRWDRPMARFLKKLDQAVGKEARDAYVVAVWLTENPKKTKEYLPVAQGSLQLEATALTCFTGKGADPRGWNINADAHLTAVVANKQKVAAVFGYRSINETDVPAVRTALTKARKRK